MDKMLQTCMHTCQDPRGEQTLTMDLIIDNFRAPNYEACMQLTPSENILLIVVKTGKRTREYLKYKVNFKLTFLMYE